MKKTDAYLYLPLVQALADGKTIQSKDSDTWTKLDCPSFTRPPWEYRIKPEPRKWTVWLIDNDYIVHEKTIGKIYPGYKMIEVAEILPKNEQ
jgi:hypothetical protein